MARKIKNRKMDVYKISNQVWEIQYVASLFGVKPEVVRSIKKAAKTSSRRKIYNEIRKLLVN